MEKESKHYFRKFVLFIIFIGALTVLYSYFIGTKGLVVREYKIVNSKLPDNYHGLKVIHFSDLHFVTTVKLPEVKHLVEEINFYKPKIVFFTGDLIDRHYKIGDKELADLIKTLNEINPEIGSYMVKGNHDYNEYFDELVNQTNIKLLNNTSELFYEGGTTPLLIIGVEDYLVGTQDIETAFSTYNEEYYTILLAHEPDTVKKLTIKPDLVLSGHSHNGQVRIPFIGAVLKVDGARMYYDEKYIIDNTELYISGGIGTSGLKFRLFNKPSINLYRFYNK